MFILIHISIISRVLHSFLKIWISIWLFPFKFHFHFPENFPLEFLVIYEFSGDKFYVLFYLKTSLFCFYSWRIFSLDIELWVDEFNIMRNSFHKQAPISKTFLMLCIFFSCICNMLFYSGCFQDFFLYLWFSDLENDMSRLLLLLLLLHLLCLRLLGSLNLLFCILRQNWEFFLPLFFQTVFLSYFLSSQFLRL